MATPTIIIGIGSSGLYTLENVQRFYYESFKKNKPDHVEYLYIETNSDNKVGITPLPSEIKQIYVSLGQIELMVRNIKRYYDGKWLPPTEQLVDAGAGAGGIRPCGRLSLWGSNDEGDNFVKVISAIETAHQKVSSYTQAGDVETQPVVFITGSLTGGTGSGIFIDMAYLIKYLIKNVKFTYGLFLLPPKPKSLIGKEVIYANTYGALLDIEAFNSIENIYKEKWPNRALIEKNEPPYDLAQFISQDYLDGSPALQSLEGLYKMAGLYLFLNIAGIYAKRKERLVDARGNMVIGKYGTFGLSGIQYPKDQIQEYVASLLSVELFERWIDPSKYIFNNSEHQIIEGSIGEQTIYKWDDIIKVAFNNLNIIGGIGGRDIVQEIELLAIKINKRDINETPLDYLNKLFSSNISNNFYSQVKNNIQTAVNSIVDQIHDYNVFILNKTENLTYTKTVLKKISDAIDKNIKYWKSIEISEEPAQWENLLRKQCNWMIKKRYKLLLEHDNVLNDRMLTTFELMKMHLMISKLGEVKDNITREDVSYKSTSSEKELPRINIFNKLINQIAEVTGKIDSKKMSLKKRMVDIEKDINDTTIPILRIYPKSSFNKECEDSQRIYCQQTNNIKPSKSDVLQDDLWIYLKKHFEAKNLHDTLYVQSLTAYREKISLNNCVPDYEVSKYIIDHPEDGRKMARKALSPFISLDNIIFSTNVAIPRFVVGSNDNNISEVLDIFNNSLSFSDFSNDRNHKLELPGLKNIMVFFDEKGNYNPLVHLSYIEQMKDVYENPPETADPNLTVEVWKNYRKAYIPILKKASTNE